MIINVHRSSCKVTFVLLDCNEIEFSVQISEKYSNIKLHANPSMGAASFHADGQM